MTLVGERDALLREAVEPVGFHATRDDGGNTHAELATFDAQPAAEPDEAPFGGVIRTCVPPGTTAAVDATLTMSPRRCCCIWGRTARAIRNGPRRFTPITRSHCSTDMSLTGVTKSTPAQEMASSMRPQRLTMPRPPGRPNRDRRHRLAVPARHARRPDVLRTERTAFSLRSRGPPRCPLPRTRARLRRPTAAGPVTSVTSVADAIHIPPVKSCPCHSRVAGRCPGPLQRPSAGPSRLPSPPDPSSGIGRPAISSS